jgi:GNAT superfamily N-acetyltransferase
MPVKWFGAMDLPLECLRIADGWWAQDFGCAADDLRPSATRVQVHAGRMSGDPGVWILALSGSPLISLPPSVYEQLGGAALGWTASMVADAAYLMQALGPYQARRVIGPAIIGYTTQAPPRGSASARRLTDSDLLALANLRNKCAVEEWQHGGSDLTEGPVFGVFDGTGELQAIAGYETWGERIAHIAVVTAPLARGRGYGSAVVARAARHALADGLLAQYRTLAGNAPSMGIARRLGFESYGFSSYVRMGSPPA